MHHASAGKEASTGHVAPEVVMTQDENAKGNGTLLTFLGTTEQSTVLLEAKVNADEIRASEQLRDHSGGDDRGDSKFHEGTAVRRQNDTHPIQGVGRVGRHNVIEGYLRADQETEESNGGP